MSTQAQRLLDRFTAQRAELAELGAHASPSWRAVAEGCRRCAMCLHGCPYGLIFNAGDAVDRLGASPGFTYRPNACATRFQETADGVRLWIRDAAGELTELSGDRLFVAAGVLPLQFSAGQTRRTLRLDGSEQFDITGLGQTLVPAMTLCGVVTRADGSREECDLIARLETRQEAEYFRHGGILNYALRKRCQA